MLPTRRIPSLDGFRAVAVLLVIGSHVVLSHSNSTEDTGILANFYIGGAGVRIFFVISGFLITYLLLTERSITGKVDLGAFYIRRVLRIFPAFYCYLIALSILNSFLDLDISALHFLSAALYLHNFYFWGSNWFINHTWSLAVEEQFYLIWPFIFVLIGRLKKNWIWFCVLLIGGAVRSLQYKFPETSNFFLAPFLMHADFLFSGCFLAYLKFYEPEKITTYINNVKPVFIYIAIFVIWVCTTLEYHPVYDRLFVPISGAIVNLSISFLIMYFVVREDSLGFALLNASIMTFIGKLSYSLYIWQQVFLSSKDFWFTSFPSNLILTFLTAYGSYTFIEKPFLKLKDRFR